MKLKILATLLLALLLVGLVFQKQLTTHLKIVLFISEQFPQIPVKPLKLVTEEPVHEQLELNSVNGPVMADLFTPALPPSGSGPALIIAMGIKTADKDKPIILHLAQTLARLDYVVIWPRLKVLDQGQSLPEEPETFVKAFEYLTGLPSTNPERISLVGFSVGSSVAYVAASDERTREKVHGLIFFGGYSDIFDYLISLATKQMVVDNQTVNWAVADDARDHAQGLLEAKRAANLVRIFEAKTIENVKSIINKAPEKELSRLETYNPSSHLSKFKAPIFILHDQSDNYVPYVESIKLKRVLPQEQVKSYLLINLFEHVQPKKAFSLEIIREFAKLYGFLYKVMDFL